MALIPSALWCSPFRPFFLLGALYGPLLILSWISLYSGLLPASWRWPWGDLPLLYHQHEMIFGFATAIISGFLLTALPSWAGTEEVRGPRLLLLVLCWVAARLCIILSSILPLPLIAIVDLSFPLLFAVVVGPGLIKAGFRINLGLAVILAGFLVGNLCYYLGTLGQDEQLWRHGLRIGLYAMIFHCSVTVGALAPIFTGNALQERAHPTVIGHIPVLEWLSAISILVLAIADISGATPAVCGSLALVSGILHGVRLYRWRSLSIIDTPIVWVLHLGYAWLVGSFLLYAMQGFGVAVGTESWVHAFTVGGFGLMSLGLMTRVTLRHTGRELRPPPVMTVAYLCLTTAALLRVAIPLTALRYELLLVSAILWIASYVIYLLLYGRFLLTPSLPH